MKDRDPILYGFYDKMADFDDDLYYKHYANIQQPSQKTIHQN